MLRIVHHNCAGMDIHKKFIAVCIATTDFKGVTTYKKKRFATFNSDLKACRDWLLKEELCNMGRTIETMQKAESKRPP